MATGPGTARAGLVAMEPGQEAAGDSLGSSIEGLASGDDGLEASGDDGLEASGDDGLDASGLVTGAVVGRVVVELAPGLLHAAIAPTRAKASRILLNMRSTPRMCPGRVEFRLGRRCRPLDPTQSGVKDPSGVGSRFGCSRLADGARRHHQPGVR